MTQIGQGSIATPARAKQSPALVHAHHEERAIIEGAEVNLSSRTAQALVMAIHELVTNAAKYGALSTEGGLITIRWRTEQRDDKESRRV